MKRLCIHGFDVLIGQNARENWRLFDQALPDDWWFHLDEFPSGHVFLRNPDGHTILPLEVVHACAWLAKQQSKYNQGIQRIVYAQVKYLTKGDVVGVVESMNEYYVKV